MALQISDQGSDSGRTQKKKASIKQGKSVWRILPGLGNGSRNGKNVWRSWNEVIWGFENSEGFSRPFQSCQVKNHKSKMIEVVDPARDWIVKSKEDLEQVNALLKKTPNSKPLKDKARELEALVGFEDGQFNLSKGWEVNALNLAGEVYRLRIGYKEMLAFDAECKRMKTEDNIDPVKVVGCFMEFNKSGTSRDVVVSVKPFEDKDETGAKRTRMHTITEADLDAIELGYTELEGIYMMPTAEEVQEILDGYFAGDGGAAVDRILNYKAETEEVVTAKPKITPATKSQPKPTPVSAVAEDNLPEEEAETVEVDSSLSMEDDQEDTILDVIKQGDVQASLQADLARMAKTVPTPVVAKTVAKPAVTTKTVAKPTPSATPTAAGKPVLSDAERQFMIDMKIDPDTGM